MAKKQNESVTNGTAVQGLTRRMPREDSVAESVLEAIRENLAGLRFGQVTIVVHNGEVVQIDRTERQRLI